MVGKGRCGWAVDRVQMSSVGHTSWHVVSIGCRGACNHGMSATKAAYGGEDRLTVTQGVQGSGEVWVEAQGTDPWQRVDEGFQESLSGLMLIPK